jgi:outer membrane receptor protein involved in Fe transport
MRQILSKVLLLTTIICIITVKLFAQTTGVGKISGKIIDAQTNETIPFASAILLDKKTKSTIKVVQSDVNGAFVISNLPKGIFTFKASYVGYQTMVRDSVSISDVVTEVNFGSIKMKTAKGNLLNEVTVSAPKTTMQLGIDKKVFSVDQSLVSEGGSASDLLQNVPSVQTDIDGNVSLRGSSGVKVLIDGKPSLIAGGNVAQILQSIPASSIESVELITNPSAKYDAEGQSGIINIVLKRNKKLGFNGSLALTAGNRDNYNANTNLSFQNKKINLYGNYSYRYGNRLGGGFNNIEYNAKSSSLAAFANQSNDSRDLNKGHNIKAGLDYYLAEKSVVSFSTGLNVRNESENEFLSIDQLGIDYNPLKLSNKINSEIGGGNSYDFNLDFTQKFKKSKEELTASFGFSTGDNDNQQLYTTNIYNENGATVSPAPEVERTNRENTNRNYNGQLDYTLPIGKGGKIEAGIRSQIRISESSTYAEKNTGTGQFNFNHDLSNLFNNKDQVHAVYMNYQNQVKNFGYQLGLRAEDASLDTRLGSYDVSSNVNYNPGRVAYTRIYPSVFLTQKFTGDQQVQLSYSRRVNRPRGWDTNPFLDVSDPLVYRQGNVNLKPEDVHAFELSYSKYFTKWSLISTAYVRQTNDVIQRIRIDLTDGITLVTPQNLTRNVASGLELIGKFDLYKSWNFTANVNLYQSKIVGAPAFGIAENSGFSYNANLTNNFVLPYGITMQLRGEYRSREVMAQGTRKAMYGMDAGAKYDLMNKKASLSLNIRDVFATRKWQQTTNGLTSITDFSRYMQGTMANLTFSYRFGKTDFNFKKTKKSDEQNNRPDEESF